VYNVFNVIQNFKVLIDTEAGRTQEISPLYKQLNDKY